MRILLVFDPVFEGEAADAVWIIDTPANRHWFVEHQAKLDPNSAIFSSIEAQAMVWEVQEQHPAWTEMEVVGLAIDSEDLASLSEDGSVTLTEGGFRLLRQ